MQPNPYAQYKQMEVSTTDPLKLVVMLYDGAISAIKRAIEHINRRDMLAKHKELMRAHDIIFELMACLDKERGGEVAQNLQSLYTYMINRLMEANATLNVDILNEVAGLLANLNESWRELARRRGLEPGNDPKPVLGRAASQSDGPSTTDAVALSLSGKERTF